MTKKEKRRRYEGFKFLHNKWPDYEKAQKKIPKDFHKKIMDKLTILYGQQTAKTFIREIERICRVYRTFKSDEMIELESSFDVKDRFSEEDIILITYGDLIREDGVAPLTTLSKFCGIYLQQTINTLHILPFFPYSSDKGFSITDFKNVDPRLGTWENIEDLEYRYKLMFDGVINHVSSKSYWFQEFLNDNPYFREFFISYKSKDDLSIEERNIIFRPRTSDILTRFDTINGDKYVWTTFSKDQIDLAYKNPNVLIRVIEILLLYVRRGADIIRLDAVTFLWTNPGTTCANLDETHNIVKLFRDILDVFAPHVVLITETNIPHKDNITYFGNGYDEAQMVYNFSLPPLVLYTFYSKNSIKLSEWAASLKPVSELTTFFNFLDSHDGIGLMAVKDILSQSEIDFINKTAKEHGGFISYKIDKGGVEIPYEINITWFSALNKEDTDEPLDIQVDRFVASRAIALAMQGVPGIYLHSFFGTKNDKDAMSETQSNREINRTIINYNTLMRELNTPNTLTAKISNRLRGLIAIRIRQEAFHPNASQHILIVSSEVFVVLRISVCKKQYLLSLINITDKTVNVTIPMQEVRIITKKWFDLVNRSMLEFDNEMNITLKPYDVCWLVPDRSASF